MTGSRSIILCATVSLAVFAGPLISEATEGEKPAIEEPVRCLEKISANGRPHRISAVAGLNAVRAWVRQAKKHGQEYSFWNEAGSHTISCKKLNRSDYFLCFATGKPCRTSKPGPSNSKKAS